MSHEMKKTGRVAARPAEVVTQPQHHTTDSIIREDALPCPILFEKILLIITFVAMFALIGLIEWQPIVALVAGGVGLVASRLLQNSTSCSTTAAPSPAGTCRSRVVGTSVMVSRERSTVRLMSRWTGAICIRKGGKA